MADDYITVLKQELSASEDSFLAQLRPDMYWDTEAFSRLTAAMRECCEAYDVNIQGLQPTLMEAAYDREQLPRWLVEGFWLLSWIVRDWTMHPAWKGRTAPQQDDYDKAYERLNALADWFFTGVCPSKDPSKGFAPM